VAAIRLTLTLSTLPRKVSYLPEYDTNDCKVVESLIL
jgi:hypothetical protein